MITRQMQMQAVAGLLNGQATALPIRAFDERWYLAYIILESIRDRSRDELELALFNCLKDEELGRAVLRLARNPVTYPTLEETAETLVPISWLWLDWIPRGMITLLGAVPGAGKSFLALDLARRIIESAPFPDGSPARGGGGCVIYVDAEVVPQMINERAVSWEMDRSQIYLMMPEEERFFLDFSEMRDRDTLVEMAYTLKPALIVIDSLSSISSKGENNVEDVRSVLGFLNRLAQDQGCALLLIHHLRKKSALQSSFELVSIDAFRGSSHIIAMSRSVLGLSVVQEGPTIDRNGPRRLEVVKTNLTQYPPSIGMRFEQVGDGGVRLLYGDAPSTYTEPTKFDYCIEWLRELLEDGPMSPGEIVEVAEEEGYGRTMIYRARERLQADIENTLGRQDPGNQWRLRNPK